MGKIILKKTFKAMPMCGLGGCQKNRKTLSFHGPIHQDMIATINKSLAENIHMKKWAFTTYSCSIWRLATPSPVEFHLDKDGHYCATLNHYTQKHYEEDAISYIIQELEDMGWEYKFDYNSHVSSWSCQFCSVTERLCIVFEDNKKTPPAS